MDQKMPRQAVASSGRRRSINTKITDETRAKLEAAAAESDRSLSGEIEYRMEASVKREASLETVFRRLRIVPDLAPIAEAMARIDESNDPRLKDPVARRIAVACAARKVADMLVSAYCGGDLMRDHVFTGIVAAPAAEAAKDVSFTLADWDKEPVIADDEDLQGEDVQVRGEPAPRRNRSSPKR